MIRIVSVVYLSYVITAFGQSPILFSSDNKFLGLLNDNSYDIYSTANFYGKYGSEYSSFSVNNSYGKYGSEYSVFSPNNEFSNYGSPHIYSYKGLYLGKLSKNHFDVESIGNQDGKHGNPYNPNSINNPSGLYGSDFSFYSATYLYGKSFFNYKQQTEKNNAYIKALLKTDVEYPFLYLNSKDILQKRDFINQK